MRLIKGISSVIFKSLPFGRTADDIIQVVTRIRTSQKDLDKQVEEAVGALTKSTQLITSLEDSLGKRSDELEKLQKEYTRVSELASLTEEQSKAVAEQLELAVGRNRPKQLLAAFIINVAAGFLIFIIGVFASDWVKSLPKAFQQTKAKTEQPFEKPLQLESEEGVNPNL